MNGDSENGESCRRGGSDLSGTFVPVVPVAPKERYRRSGGRVSLSADLFGLRDRLPAGLAALESDLSLDLANPSLQSLGRIRLRSGAVEDEL